MTVLQIHHQDMKTGHSEMVSQNDINSDAEMRSWEQEVKKDHPLSEGSQWMVCNEKSEHFISCAEEPQGVTK